MWQSEWGCFVERHIFDGRELFGLSSIFFFLGVHFGGVYLVVGLSFLGVFLP